MRRTKRQQCMATWAACFAVLLASLAPSLSHLVAAYKIAGVTAHLPAPASAGMHARVTSGGNAHAMHDMVAGLTGDTSPQHPMPDAAIQSDGMTHGTGPHAPALHLEHCPFCFTHAGSFGLAPSVDLSLPDVSRTAVAPDLFYRWPGRAFIWTTAQARAPPGVA